GDDTAAHVLVQLLRSREALRVDNTGAVATRRHSPGRGRVLAGQRRERVWRGLLSRSGRRDASEGNGGGQEERALHHAEHSAGRCKGRSAGAAGDTFWASVW